MVDYTDRSERSEERLRAYEEAIEWTRNRFGDAYVNPDYFVWRFWEKACRIYEDGRSWAGGEKGDPNE